MGSFYGKLYEHFSVPSYPHQFNLLSILKYAKSYIKNLLGQPDMHWKLLEDGDNVRVVEAEQLPPVNLQQLVAAHQPAVLADRPVGQHGPIIVSDFISYGKRGGWNDKGIFPI